MKFYSDIPNLHIVRERKLGNRTEPFLLCKFDEKGELESEDAEVIRHLINIYRHEEVKKVFICKKCKTEFDNTGLLAAHYKKEHPQKPTCKSCKKVFETKEELKAHQKSEHPKK